MTIASPNYTIIPDIVEAFYRRLDEDDFFKSLGLNEYLAFDGNFVEQEEYVDGFWAVSQSALPCFYLEPRFPMRNRQVDVTDPPLEAQVVELSGAVCTHMDAAGFTSAGTATGAIMTIFDALGDPACGGDSLIRSGVIDGFTRNASDTVAILNPISPNTGLYWEARFEIEFYKTRSAQ